MVGITQPRPFKAPKRKKQKIKLPTKQIKLNIATPLLLKIIRFSIFLVVFGYGSARVLKETIFSDQYLITEVQYAQDSVDKYDDPYIYADISELIKNENYFVVRYLHRKEIKNQIKAKYQLISDMEIQHQSFGSAIVTVEFYQPDIVFLYENKKFGLYDDYLFGIYTGNSIGDSAKKVILPEYIGNLENLDGMFFEIPSSVLRESISILFQYFPDMLDIIYMPGAERIILDLPNGIRLYFSNFKEIQPQIDRYTDLQKYYTDFANIKAIDLGSLSEDQVIVTK